MIDESTKAMAEAALRAAADRVNEAAAGLEALLPHDYPSRPAPISVGRLFSAARVCAAWRADIRRHVGPTWRPSPSWAAAPLWREAVIGHPTAVAAALAALLPPAAVLLESIRLADAARALAATAGTLHDAARDFAAQDAWDAAFAAAEAAGESHEACHAAACEAAFVELPEPPHPLEADEGAASALKRALEALMRAFAWAANPRAPWPASGGGK